jgi:hypothetical protein
VRTAGRRAAPGLRKDSRGTRREPRMGFTGAPGSRPAPLSSMSTAPRAVTSGCGRPALTYVHVCRFTRVASGEIRGVSDPAAREPCPAAELIALARGHAVFCRRDIAPVAMALRVEFSGKDEPVGRELERVTETAIKRIARPIQAGRRDGSIPPGPPARTVASPCSERSRGPSSPSVGRRRTTNCWPNARFAAFSGSSPRRPHEPGSGDPNRHHDMGVYGAGAKARVPVRPLCDQPQQRSVSGHNGERATPAPVPMAMSAPRRSVQL